MPTSCVDDLTPALLVWAVACTHNRAVRYHDCTHPAPTPLPQHVLRRPATRRHLNALAQRILDDEADATPLAKQDRKSSAASVVQVASSVKGTAAPRIRLPNAENAEAPWRRASLALSQATPLDQAAGRQSMRLESLFSMASMVSDKGAGTIQRHGVRAAFPGFDISAKSSLAGRSFRLAPLVTDRTGRAVGVAEAVAAMQISQGLRPPL